MGPERGSLDAWTTLAALAARTERIRLGSMVSPVTFRHPSLLAKAAATADHVSGGRIELGIGAGWSEPEHESYGFHFPPLEARMEMLAEQLEIVHRQWMEEVFDFTGTHYRLNGCRALPKPVQRPRPPLIVGGRGGQGTVGPAVRFADEYNTFYASPERCRELRGLLDGACERVGRDPSSLPLSLMTGLVAGSDRAETLERAHRVATRSGEDGDPAAFLDQRREQWVAGTAPEVVERLRELEEAGVERVLLQHLDHEDLETVALLGAEIAPAVA